MTRLAIGVLVAAVAATIVEGLASLIITAGLYLGPSSRFAQDVYSRYDPELGWVALPNVALPDMWGPGIGLATDGNGFRGRTETPRTAPPGKVRIMCSGDSFTFGSGVADDATWCAQLAAIDPRVESVNLGQGGYGVDQAFLRFRRDGVPFAPALHLFAFIDADFDRMRSARFLDYGKPTLAVRKGVLEVEHVPAARVRFWAPSVRTVEIMRRTRSAELVERLLGGATAAPVATHPANAPPPAEIIRTALAVFDALETLAAADGGRVVLVRLPITSDCLGVPPAVGWWATLAPELARRGRAVVDLADDCRQLPPAELGTLFIREGDARYWGGEGHYTVAGNRFFAQALHARIRATIDALATR